MIDITVWETINEKDFNEVISTLCRKYGGIISDIPEMLFDKNSKTIWYTQREIVFWNQNSIIVIEKHKIRIEWENIIPGKAINFVIKEINWF